MRRVLLLGAGGLALLLAAIGLLLPVWPTTPFLLVSAGCFSGTPALRAWLLRLPFFRAHLENYRSRCGLSAGTVAISLVYLWGMLALSAVLTRKVWLALLLGAVGAAVTVHILLMARGKRV